MINIDKKYQIKVKNDEKNLRKKKNIILKIYKRNNVLNGSWKWLNDKKVTALMDKGYKKNTLKNQLAYFDKIKKSKRDLLFAIYINDKHVGNVGLHKINFKLKTAQFGIIIGNSKFHNKGIGKAVWYEIIKFAFDYLDMSKIFTMIVTKNIPSIKIAKKLGFKKMSVKSYIIKYKKKLSYPKFFLTKANFRKII